MQELLGAAENNSGEGTQQPGAMVASTVPGPEGDQDKKAATRTVLQASETSDGAQSASAVDTLLRMATMLDALDAEQKLTVSAC